MDQLLAKIVTDELAQEERDFFHSLYDMNWRLLVVAHHVWVAALRVDSLMDLSHFSL